jgi:hypothetical protein
MWLSNKTFNSPAKTEKQVDMIASFENEKMSVANLF